MLAHYSLEWYTERVVYLVSRKEYNKHMSATKKYSSQFKQETLVLLNVIGLKEAAKKQGFPYSTLSDWWKTLGKHFAIQSMSYVGKCFDNVRMESFLGTLKKTVYVK